MLGLTYRGVVAPGNTGPQSGHNVVSEPVTRYLPSHIAEAEREIEWSVAPNPTNGFLRVIVPAGDAAWKLTLSDMLGRHVASRENVRHDGQTALDLDRIPAGLYHLRLRSGPTTLTRAVVVAH